MQDPDAAATAGVVQVWVAPLDPPAEVLESLVATLDPAERARAGRYRFADDARRFRAARGWLRHVLGAELAADPAAVPVTEGPGKPRLADRVGPCFNVSHAGELALIAVAEREVGVDVEHEAAAPSAVEAAGLVCAADEMTKLRRMARAERPGAFLRAWTAKEAYLKATGVGLSLSPQRVEIGSAHGGRGAPVGVAGDPGATRWRVRWVRPAHDYLGAVAAEGEHWQVRLHSIAELQCDAVAGLR